MAVNIRAGIRVKVGVKVKVKIKIKVEVKGYIYVLYSLRACRVSLSKTTIFLVICCTSCKASINSLKL